MWNFSDDEWFFLVLSVATVVIGGIQYYRPLMNAPHPRHWRFIREVIALLPIIAAFPTCLVLCRWADPRVVGHLDYTVLFILGAIAWIFVAFQLIEVLGISINDDARERENPAALIAIGGFVVAVGIVYALSNIGAGPTIWTTIWPALIATVLLVVLWLLMEWIGGSMADAITIDRDIATGLRIAGAALGCSMVIGFATAGDWISWHQTWVDLAVRGWPAVLIAVAAGAFHRRHRPTPNRPTPEIVSFGIMPAAFFIAMGALAAFSG